MFVNYKEMGRRIASRRKHLGLKQVEVNEAADLSDKYLSNIETGRSIPSIDVLMRLCAALDTTPNDLLLGAVSQAKSASSDAFLSAKCVGLEPKKQRLLSSFIDWLAEQEL